MRANWKRWAIAATITIASGALVVGCTDEVSLVSESTAGSDRTGPNLTGGTPTNLALHSCQTNGVGRIAGTAGQPNNLRCIELWGLTKTLEITPADPSVTATYTCVGVGSVQNIADDVTAPIPNDGRMFQTSVTERAGLDAPAVSTQNYSIELTFRRPTVAGPVLIGCQIEKRLPSYPLPGHEGEMVWIGRPRTITIDTTISVEVIGELPVLTEIMIPPATTVTLPLYETIDLDANLIDQYGYPNAPDILTPVTWTSQNTSIATVDSATGLVRGVSGGTTMITASAGGLSKNKQVTVKGCTIAVTPGGSFTVTGDNYAARDAAITCEQGSGITPASQPVVWSADNPGIVAFSQYPDDVQKTYVWARGVGTTLVRACLPAPALVCAPDVSGTFNATFITTVMATGSTNLTVGANSTGSVGWSAQNSGNSTKTAIFACSSTGAVTCTSPNPVTWAMGPGGGTGGTVSWYTGSATGAGSITVTATGGGTRTWNFTVGSPGFSTTIVGPSSVKPNVSCEFDPSPAGGTGPYTHAWTVNGSPVESEEGILWYVNSGSSFTLGLTSTDALGGIATATKSVTVSSSAPTCLN